MTRRTVFSAISLTLLCPFIPALATDNGNAAEVSAADTSQFVTALRGVEIVGVKHGLSRQTDLVSTINAIQIDRENVQSVRDISVMVPNLFMPKYGSRQTSSIYMRGLGSRIDQPAVGLNVDNVPYLNKDGYDFAMADIASVEVIRGSAGVLNGRNALAGQINNLWAYSLA